MREEEEKERKEEEEDLVRTSGKCVVYIVSGKVLAESRSRDCKDYPPTRRTITRPPGPRRPGPSRSRGERERERERERVQRRVMAHIMKERQKHQQVAVTFETLRQVLSACVTCTCS